MDFVADENVEPITLHCLRGLGNNVFSILEASPGALDKDILMRAASQNRVVVTYDLDFGELVFRERVATAGIILLRLSLPKASDRLARLQQCWDIICGRLAGNFIVVGDNNIRIRPIVPGGV